MVWRGYKECCYRSALDKEAGFCEECGTPLLRCIAFDECRGLVGPESPCSNCIAPEISLDQGAVTSAGIGHSLALPLILKNTATAPRTLRVDDVRVRRGSGEFASVPIPWQRVEPGEERSFTVETGPLTQGGTANIDVALALSSSHGGYVEKYLFGVSVGIGVAEQQRETTVHQTIDMTGSTGGLVNIKDNSTNGNTALDPGNPDRALLAVSRYEKDERQIGLRGYVKTGQHIPRSVEFLFSGFPERHAPSKARIGSRGALVMGRYARVWHETDNPDPSDVTLRITDPSTGQTDPDVSHAVSRRHIDVLVLNERLYMHVRGSNGVAVNGEVLAPLTLKVIEDGDTVALLPKQPDALSLTFRFLALPDGTVEKIQIDRQPADAYAPAQMAPPSSTVFVPGGTIVDQGKTGSDTSSFERLETGTTFDDRYIIEKTIGSGGMGVVYLAEDSNSSPPRRVALKLINAQVIQDADAIDRLISEGTTTRDIRHPNIVAVYDVVRSADQAYIVMEYVEGRSLRDWFVAQLKSIEEVSVDAATGIIHAILDGLQAAHDAGITHRDLKPENVVLLGDPKAGDYRLRILDFGIAKAVGPSAYANAARLGSPDYMAPEQKNAPEAAGPSADIYSLSRILYELLMGVRPEGSFQPPSQQRSDVPVGLDDLLEKGLNLRPRSRQQSVAEYRDQMHAAFKKPGLVPPPSTQGGFFDNAKYVFFGNFDDDVVVKSILGKPKSYKRWQLWIWSGGSIFLAMLFL